MISQHQEYCYNYQHKPERPHEKLDLFVAPSYLEEFQQCFRKRLQLELLERRYVDVRCYKIGRSQGIGRRRNWSKSMGLDQGIRMNSLILQIVPCILLTIKVRRRTRKSLIEWKH